MYYILEEACEECCGSNEYYDSKNNKMVKCGCVNGWRPTEAGLELLKFIKKYRNFK